MIYKCKNCGREREISIKLKLVMCQCGEKMLIKEYDVYKKTERRDKKE